jgi:nucleoid-associated protein YgaU
MAKGSGKNGVGSDGATQTGAAQAKNALSGGVQTAGTLVNGRNLNSAQAQTAISAGAQASGTGVGGQDAVLMASRDPASAQALQAEGSPIQGGVSAKIVGVNPSGSARGPASADGAQMIDYRVKEGDTLMKIAFEIFGDLTRWREILELNKEVINDPNILTKGTRLRIKVFGVRTVSRNGEAYLIKRGDTLQKISHWVYGTINKWKKLWDNNRELIQDPNKIFAGFKLYFVREQDPKRVPAESHAVPVKNDSSH